jgi:hypothetical protein
MLGVVGLGFVELEVGAGGSVGVQEAGQAGVPP